MDELCFVCKNLDDNILEELRKLWKSNVPSKAHMFGLRLLLNRLPLRLELVRTSITQGIYNMVCPLCFEDEELQFHLFLLYPFVYQVWSKFFLWIGIDSTSIEEIMHVNLNKIMFFT